MIRSFSRTAAIALLAAATAAAGALSTATSASAGTKSAATTSAAAAISRDQVIANAKTWNPHTPNRIPYSQTRYHQGYRTDCSGYASMALGLRGPGLNTVGLAGSNVSRQIGMGELQKGDLVIDALGNNNTRHVVIFEGWTDNSHRAYWAYEQRGGYGTDHRVLSYGIGGGEYRAYRPHVLGGGNPNPPQPPAPGKFWVDTFRAASGHGSPGGARTGTLNVGRHYVFCKVRGPKVQVGNQFNHWWMKTDLDSGNPWRNQYVSAYYLKRWGNDVAKDNNGTDIPNC